MATYVFRDAYVSIAGTAISDHVKSVTLNTGIETGDKTAMGDTTRVNMGGLRTWDLSVTVHGDFASGELDALIAGLTGNEAALIVKPNGGTTAATNPKWTGTGLVDSYTPFGGSVGDTPAEATVHFIAASALTRAESD